MEKVTDEGFKIKKHKFAMAYGNIHTKAIEIQSVMILYAINKVTGRIFLMCD